MRAKRPIVGTSISASSIAASLREYRCCIKRIRRRRWWPGAASQALI
jgi:hypothetical protein